MSLRYLGIFFFLALLWMPFATFRDFYPFYRFGMFAELRETQNIPEEYFDIFYEKHGHTHKCSSDLLGINPVTFKYLKRNHYYRNQSEILLKTIADRFEDGKKFRWTFYRTVKTPEQKIVHTLVYTLKPSPAP